MQMKSSDAPRLDRWDVSRSRRSRRPELNESERKCRILEFRPLRLSKERSSEASRPTTNLPPISKARTVTGRVATQHLHRKESAKPKAFQTPLPPGNRIKENSFLHVIVTQRVRPKLESNKQKRTGVVQDSELLGGGGPRKDRCESRVTMPERTKRDASFCSESEESEESGDGRQEDSEDEYYTEQRITEWVLRVNSSLFSAGDDLSSDPPEEQEVAAIKIIYSGD